MTVEASVSSDMHHVLAATAQLMIALLSKRYFDSEQDGRDWAVFNARMVEAQIIAEANGSSHPSLEILPAKWNVSGPVPREVARVNWDPGYPNPVHLMRSGRGAGVASTTNT